MSEIKTKFIVPNLFTSLNFLLGVWSICYSAGAFITDGDSANAIRTAAHLIILCALLDKLDGFAARMMNASSEFGAQFDSLADLIAFGLAPALAIFFAYKEFVPEWFEAHTPLMMASLSLYVLTAAMRLAKFNAMDADAYPGFFVGLPSTFAGMINALMLWLLMDYDFFTAQQNLHIPLLIFIATALLMVSPFFLPKPKTRKNKLINIWHGTCVVVIYVLGFAMIYPEILAILAVYFFVFGFGEGFLKRQKIMTGQLDEKKQA
jgi:CDP-diacylglycerol---serine O-phosphatidyltransferase